MKILPKKDSKCLKKWTFGPKKWWFIQILLYWWFKQEWRFICVDTVANFKAIRRPELDFWEGLKPGPVLLGPNPSLDYEDRKIDLTNLYDPLNKQFCGVSNNVLTDMTCCYLYTAEPLLMKGSGE